MALRIQRHGTPRGVRHERRQRWPLLVLAVAAASTDAISYLGLDEVFPANMTGNTVLLGIGISTEGYGHAARSAVALGGFVLGAAVAGASSAQHGWTRAVRASLLAEFGSLAAAGIWWLTLSGDARGGARFGLIALVSLAMGLQSGAIGRTALGVSTTYITGTWTAVSGWVARRVRRLPEDATEQAADQPRRVQAVVLGCYFGSALLSGFLYHQVGSGALFVAVAAVGVVGASQLPARRATSEPRVSRTAPREPGRPAFGRPRRRAERR
jgi:uncharacterized membrane protein YoaK (UPF0700 family)